MRYGLPYKGSKNKLAERIVRLLPKRTHLVDLFCGGCAVSHAALLMGKYEHIHINDINWMCPTLFIDALNGKYKDERRWISREDFFRLKDTDPYVAVVWSFGNNLCNYIYSRKIEPFKKAIHYAMFFSDYSLGKELGHDLSFIDPIQDIQKRYIAMKHYFNKLDIFRPNRLVVCAESTPIYRIGGAEKTCRDWRQWKGLQASVRVATPGMYQSGVAIQKKSQDKSSTASGHSELHRLQHLERQHSLPRYSGGGWQFLPITSSVLDYEDVTIPEDSVIYCDIPYYGTDGYLEKYKGGFDYERFYQWCERQTQPVFISSYQMPANRFDCIEEITHRSTFSATANNLLTERIFVPKHQTERGNRAVQLTLF